MTNEAPSFPRRATAGLTVGGVRIGGGAPVSVQSMTKTDTRDVRATLAQVHRLEKAGCEIVRLAVPDAEAAVAMGRIISSEDRASPRREARPWASPSHRGSASA